MSFLMTPLRKFSTVRTARREVFVVDVIAALKIENGGRHRLHFLFPRTFDGMRVDRS